MSSEKKATAAKLTHHGGARDPEDLDRTPVEMPLNCRRPTPLHELIARMVQEQVQATEGNELESFEEADDFSDPEEENLLDMSPYTLTEMPPAEESTELDEDTQPTQEALQEEFTARWKQLYPDTPPPNLNPEVDVSSDEG